MGRTRTIRFDATRAFSATVIGVGLLASAFVAGFRVGQEVPLAQAEQDGPAAEDRVRHSPDSLAPLRAPEQRIPVDTYTFYDQTRTLTREPSETPDPAEAIEPSAAAEPTLVDVRSPGATTGTMPPAARVLEREPVAIGVPERVAPGAGHGAGPVPGGTAGGPPVPRDLDDADPVAGPAANPGAIQRVAVVAAPQQGGASVQ